MRERIIGEEEVSGCIWNGQEFVTPFAYRSLQHSDPGKYGPVIPWSPEGAPAQAAEESKTCTVPAAQPWEGKRHFLIRAVKELLRVVDPDPAREGLAETPARAAKAWEFWTSGYGKNPADILKVFEDGAKGCDQMVVVRDIPVYSHCEHHLAPIFGTATVGYLPNGRIVGLSKLNRLVDMYARRLQVQERLTNQIADALMEHLQPRGVGVIITARHFCMESRGVQHVGCSTKTSALHGEFRDDPTVRAEFMSLVK